MHMWAKTYPCKMKVILIIFLFLRVGSVFNSKIDEEDDDFDIYDDWGIKSEYTPLGKDAKISAAEPPRYQNIREPLEISPTSVTDLNSVEDAFAITKEWIETHLIPTFKSGKLPPISIIKKIIRDAKFNFASEDTIEDIYAPHEGKLVIVGDIHGQLESTLTIFEDFGFPSEKTAYLFNGDIVDRGDKSIECILMVLAYKVALFGHFHVSRGNHESLSCGLGSFYEECQERLPNYPSAFHNFQVAFESLPYGYVVEGKYFVTHGGIGPGMKIEDLKYLFRTEYSYRNHRDLMAMLWNDPCEDTVPVNEHLLAPSTRGNGCMKFHPILTKLFLDHHGLQLLIRSHQMVWDGSELSQFGMCLTIFSAPNYVKRGNRGAVVVVTEDDINVQEMRG